MSKAVPHDPHEIDVTYVPVCGVCWESVHLDDEERWHHS